MLHCKCCRVFCLLLSTTLLSFGYAAAGQLSLSGESLTWNPAQPSPHFVVGINNSSATSDPLLAWMLGLQISPATGASGGLAFADADLPTNYLLNGVSEGLVPAFAGPSVSLGVIGDSDSDPNGIVVPASGRNLLDLDFVASPGTHGTFNIAVVPDEFQGASWFSSDFQAREFANVPFTGGAVVIGSVTVVPEPSGFVLGALAVCIVSVCWLLRQCVIHRFSRSTTSKSYR